MRPSALRHTIVKSKKSTYLEAEVNQQRNDERSVEPREAHYAYLRRHVIGSANVLGNRLWPELQAIVTLPLNLFFPTQKEAQVSRTAADGGR